MTKVASIKWGYLSGKRQRHAGCNARLGVHGTEIHEPIAQITMDDGSSGIGFSRITKQQAEELLGLPLEQLFTPETGVTKRGRILDFALWDLYARRLNQPVYAVLNPSLQGQFRVPCYDTTLYFDDLHLSSDADAAALIARQAQQGYERGHRAFKIKVGRGAMHMPLEAGTQRDIDVIQAVRETIGRDCALMIDANNGYNVNLVKRVLTETANCKLYWIEEPFHEDPVLYRHLQEWMDQQGLKVMLADGEGDAAPQLMEWARDGRLDVVQYSLLRHDFSFWLEIGQQLDHWGVKSAPHNYGSLFAEIAACQLTVAVQGLVFVEWDHIDLVGLDAAGYVLEEGRIRVPDAPGFGLELDESALQDGFTVGKNQS